MDTTLKNRFWTLRWLMSAASNPYVDEAQRDRMFRDELKKVAEEWGITQPFSHFRLEIAPGEIETVTVDELYRRWEKQRDTLRDIWRAVEGKPKDYPITRAVLVDHLAVSVRARDKRIADLEATVSNLRAALEAKQVELDVAKRATQPPVQRDPRTDPQVGDEWYLNGTRISVVRRDGDSVSWDAIHNGIGPATESLAQFQHTIRDFIYSKRDQRDPRKDPRPGDELDWFDGTIWCRVRVSGVDGAVTVAHPFDKGEPDRQYSLSDWQFLMTSAKVIRRAEDAPQPARDPRKDPQAGDKVRRSDKPWFVRFVTKRAGDIIHYNLFDSGRLVQEDTCNLSHWVRWYGEGEVLSRAEDRPQPVRDPRKDPQPGDKWYCAGGTLTVVRRDNDSTVSWDVFYNGTPPYTESLTEFQRTIDGYTQHPPAKAA